MFVGEQCGKAEDTINFYTSVFGNAKVDHVLRYGKDEAPDKEGTPLWTALARTASPSTKPFRLSSGTTLKKK
jgi:predicted 3-demethylubiquinone-9 3-methyltransferase (glyoxalase superfamily)